MKVLYIGSTGEISPGCIQAGLARGHDTAVFNKVKQVVGGWQCRYNMRPAIALSAPHVRKRLETFRPDPEEDRLLDRIIAEQQALR